MAALETAMTVVHVLFAVAWVGATVFLAAFLLPAVRSGRITMGLDAVQMLSRRVVQLSRVSFLVLLLTGGHLLGTIYGLDVGMIASTGRGQLVLAMGVLGVLLVGLVEAGGGRLRKGGEEALLPAERLFQAAAGVGLLLFVVAALIGAA